MSLAPIKRRDRFAGLLLGTALGDSLGYPAEGLAPQRIKKLYKAGWQHRFIFGYGLVSDDTDHTVFVAQALLAHPDDVAKFTKRLARSLKWWLLAGPVGIGRATLVSIFRLWIGIPPARSGIYSAGNGAAMRAALLGAYFCDDRTALDAYLEAQTIVTHSDPKALTGAKAVAYLAAHMLRTDLAQPPVQYGDLLRSAAPGDAAWQAIVDDIEEALSQQLTVEAFAAALGLADGVTGYVYHTVPVALFAWHRHFGDFKSTLEAVYYCGGDTDTVGAIAGALAGTAVGEAGMPKTWLKGLIDWPRSKRHLRRIARRLSDQRSRGGAAGPVGYFWPGILPRNAAVLILTLLHLCRRAAPPY